MGYTNPRLALHRNADKSNKKQLKELTHCDVPYHEGKNAYLNRKGLLEIVNKNRHTNASEWIKWLDGKASELENSGTVSKYTKEPLQVWKYKAKEVKIKTDKSGKEWFCGRDVCLIIGFKNINRTLLEQVKKAYKCDLKSLIPWVNFSLVYNTHKEGRAVYIFEPGLYQLKFSSRLEKAELFCPWVFEVVLPAIRGAGKTRSLFKTRAGSQRQRASRRTRQSHACPGDKELATGCKR